MRIGFIGLGVMGRPMAGHLLRAGHDVMVWARRPEAAAPLAAEGARLAASPAELGRHAEVLLTIVTRGADVAELLFGAQGAAVALAPGSLVIDMSTIAPAEARDFASRLAARGVDWLDAPVSGGGQGAQEASLAIMVGGEPDALERARPLLACLGRRIVHVGPAGCGQVAKACNQMVMVAAIQAAAEAMHLAAASGVDPERVRAALGGGSAASCVLDVFGARMVTRDFRAGVEARLHHKDFGILLAAAREMGVFLPLAATVADQLHALMAQGWGTQDTASLLRVLERADLPAMPDRP